MDRSKILARSLARRYLPHSDQYYKKVLTTRRASLLAYWPLWEASGSVAQNLEGTSARNASYTGVTLGQPGIGDGHTSPFFDGANDYVNAHSASLAAAFNGTSGSLALWFYQHPSSLNDSTLRRALMFYADSNNYLIIAHTGVNHNLQIDYKAGGVNELHSWAMASAMTSYHHLVITWSKTADEIKYYRDGEWAETDTALGTWAGSLTIAILGASGVTPTNPWYGWLAHCAVWSAVLTPTQVSRIAKV